MPPLSSSLWFRQVVVVGNLRRRAAAVRTMSMSHPTSGRSIAAVFGVKSHWAVVRSFSAVAAPSAVTAAATTTSTTTMPLPTIPHHHHHNDDMFCRQCEQTFNRVACVTQGVCGKRSETAALQDALLHVVQLVSSKIIKGQAQTAAEAAAKGVLQQSDDVNQWTVQAAFATATNVNFDDDALSQHIRQGLRLLHELTAVEQQATTTTQLAAAHPSNPTVPSPDASVEDLEEYGHAVRNWAAANTKKTADATAWREWATYSLKGACAYAAHCQAVVTELLSHSNDDDAAAAAIRAGVDAAIDEIHHLWALIGEGEEVGKRSSGSSEAFQDIGMETILRVGRLNASVLELLDRGHTQLLGAPTPTPVRTTAVEGPCILVSGHDLVDLYHLLQQTKGSGIRVYTHGEMLPAHGYPVLRQFDHLVGNYGTAWQNQKFEFAAFPGPILCTTNCVQEPRRVYKDRMYTINQVGVPGVHHVTNRDFGPVIAHAKRTKGFTRTVEPPQFQTTGYHHQSLVSSPKSSSTPTTTKSLLVDAIVPALTSGDISRILVIGGCDGSQWDRSYFTNLAEEAPDDTLILTMGCAKNRILQVPKLRHGTLGTTGLPRVLDLGQCNDAHSALLVAQELSSHLHCPPSELPLSVAWSHMEQKAAAVLTTMLALGIPRVRLGPTLPAYWTPQVQREVEHRFDLRPTGDYENDLAAMMDGK